MAHREVSIAICGAVVGVILGAGSLSFGQDSSLTGLSLEDVLRTRRATELTENARARRVSERFERGEVGVSPVDRNSYPTVKDTATQQSSSSSVAKDATICSSVTEVLDLIAAAHKKYIPGGNDARYNLLRQNLEKTIEQLRANKEYCDGSEKAHNAATEDEAMEESTVDNRCERFTPGSERYTVCRLYQRKGQLYQ
jgi:hypothetical protein